MNRFDIIKLALKNVWRRKTRTILTVSGVVIGTVAIVVMMSIGIALNVNFENQAKMWGDLNVITVYRNYNGSEGPGFNEKTVAEFEQMEHVQAVMPYKNVYLKLISGKYVAGVSVQGIDPAKLSDFGFEVEQGRLLDPNDKLTILMGAEVPLQFYNPKKQGNRWGYMGGDGSESLVDPMNDKFKLTFDTSYGEKNIYDDGTQKKAKVYKINVSGVLQNKQDGTSWYAYMDINELMTLQKEYYKTIGQKVNNDEFSNYDQIAVRASDTKYVSEIQEEIKALGYQTNSMMQYVEMQQEQASMIQMILGGIGAISLLVAAIGITNTMIMSIYERTREIGIMKVIGCKVSNIRSTFLFEAGTIGFLGGTVGIVLSYVLGAVMNKFGAQIGNALGMGMGYGDTQTYISIIPPWLALAAIVFAIIIGLVAGFYPALRATRLSALDAIKSE